MSMLPKAHALWSHAARNAQATARKLGLSVKMDRTPEHERAELALEYALRKQTRATVDVLRQELRTLSALTLDLHGVLFVRRDAVLAVVDDVLAEAESKQPSARKRRKES